MDLAEFFFLEKAGKSFLVFLLVFWEFLHYPGRPLQLSGSSFSSWLLEGRIICTLGYDRQVSLRGLAAGAESTFLLIASSSRMFPSGVFKREIEVIKH